MVQMKLSTLIFSSIALCVTGVVGVPAKRDGDISFPILPEAVPTGTTSVPVPTPTPSQGGTIEKPSDAEVAVLAPSLGFQSGLNPTGTGDCDGAVNGTDGKPIKIPCACPPAQDVYITQLQRNVAAGFAINNPTVQIAFPIDNSTQSQSARITSALITLQNLNGPGKGCPAVSTTLLAQQKALQAGINPPTL